jgi:hypothetical protein
MTSARQDSLFAPTEVAPVRAAPAVTARATAPKAARPPGWRAVTDPAREHACRVCGGAASCGVGDAWFCVADAPEGFFAGRGR